MKNVFLFFIIQTITVAQASSLSERVELLEVDKALDIFSFSGRLDTQYFKIKNSQNEKLDLYRLRNSLNVNADISSRLKFYSRLTMSKYFNTYTQQNPAPYTTMKESLVSSSLYRDAYLVVERAYFDYMLRIPLTISVGRLPTFGGEPLNFYDNLPTQSTYPMMAYNVELDGVSLTYDFYKMLPKDHQSFLRAIYTPVSHLNYNLSYYPLSLPKGVGVDGGTKVTSNSVITLAAEYSLMNRKTLLDEWRLKIFYSKLHGLSFPDITLPALPHATPPTAATPVIQFPNKMLDIGFFSIHNKFTNLA
ncbi:MAG: DUF3373 family protein, partial [Halobacteriovoraceae bacterium]|nr:DUF3373 family protein [Halobacteriovoraceae bacterium]